jgi:hypothetical protein
MKVEAKFLLLLIAFALAAGCTAPVPRHPDPLVGWKVLFTGEVRQLNQSIRDDCWNYIHRLPSDEQRGLTESSLWFYEDGTGQHAVKFETGVRGTSWTHVLFYDEGNTKIKAIKYISGHYAS